ncbi:MAG: hypothetical protein ABR583_12095 [Gaiellaceae bacterium]
MRLTRLLIVVLVAACGLVASSAAAAPTKNDFSLILVPTTIDDTSNSGCCYEAGFAGATKVAHMGPVTYEGVFVAGLRHIDYDPPYGHIFQYITAFRVVLTTKKGDILRFGDPTTYCEVYEFNDPSDNPCPDQEWVARGTGRFARVTGSGQWVFAYVNGQLTVRLDGTVRWR